MQGAVKLSTFAELRRPLDKKSACQWVRDAKAGKIPGAFQWEAGGAWYVNLDAYDEAMQKLLAPKVIDADDEIVKLGERLGLSSLEVALARAAAGVPA